jgi:hypothetical protein
MLFNKNGHKGSIPGKDAFKKGGYKNIKGEMI